jgi:alcohol dehydrogenase (cytochrome c)
MHFLKSTATRHSNYLSHASFLILFLTIFDIQSAKAQQGSMESRLEHSEREPQNWLTFYGNYKGWSYSPLNQITRENVKQLAPVWALSAGVPPADPILRPGLQAGPLVADGVIYLEGMQNNIYAADAATGKLLWTYTYPWTEKGNMQSLRGARGLAIGDGRIYMGTQDNHMVAVDAETGKEVWNIQVEDMTKCLCDITSPPLFVKGKVIAGVAGGGLGVVRGYLNAFDAKTGQRAWHFDVIPAPDQPGGDTWSGDSWKTGGGATWYTGTYDPELNLIYWGTGDPAQVYVGSARPGTNLYSTSLLALDADTGKLKWYFQETPHDLYDYDAAAEAVILDLDLAGRKRKVVLHPNKSGFAYILDRETGKYLRSFPYGSPNWAKGIDENGRPIDPLVPSDHKDFVMCPGLGPGARGIQHSAYSPRTGWWYTTDLEICSTLKGGEGAGAPILNPNNPPQISAFDPATGKKAWAFKTKYYNLSSLLTTAGDLVFGGDLEGNAFALDAKTGEKLWSFNTGGRIVAAPVSFSVAGRQFVTISSGGGANIESYMPALYPESKGHLPQPSSMLFVFALPEKAK